MAIPFFALVIVCLALVRGHGREHDVPTLKVSSIGTVPSIPDNDGAENTEKSSDEVAEPSIPVIRWKYADKRFHNEYNARMGKMARADVFADEFAKDAPMIAKALEESRSSVVVDWVKKYLTPIDPHLRWEAGPGSQPGTYDFTVTCEQRREFQPIVDTVIRKVNRKKIRNWQFWGARKPVPPDTIDNAFVARGGKVPSFKTDVITDTDNSIAMTFTSRDFSGNDTRKDLGCASLLIELALGEDNLNHWVGRVSTKKGTTKSRSVLSDTRAFVSAFEKQKKGILAKLPTKFYWELRPPEQQALVRYNPKSDDKAERKTLITWLPGFERAAGSRLFSSERFSKNGEVFCFLKARGVGELVLPEKREPLEKLIDKELRAAKVGCMIGAGSGTLESIYIDLCLPSVEQAVPKLKELCATLKLPKNTRLHFYDPEYRYEWIGMYEDTPPLSESDRL